jgi:CRP/FNR family transcriptional regulator, cyclic AMP receptor protein
MDAGSIGKSYGDGEVIFHQGEEGNCMYVIQSGKVEIIRETDGASTRLAVRGEGDFFGEMALFERGPRMATARAVGSARVLTVDKRTLLRKFQEDPSLAFRIVETMSRRIRELSEWVVSGKAGV